MTDGKDTRGFFRKVVNFVVNPRAEAQNSRPADAAVRESEFDKGELKAMIERKRRNDFVRKRELDLLRKLRREGLSAEQLAALGSSAGIDDTQSADDADVHIAEPGMKAKIDEIEQQMAEQPMSEAAAFAARRAADRQALERSLADTVADPLLSERAQAADGGQSLAALEFPRTNAPDSGFLHGGRAPISRSAIEVTEVGHDPELDEAVILYANGDNASAEALLMALIGSRGSRQDHRETWMVVFDLYRATGQQAKFETLAGEFAQRFGQSAPHWFSVPKMIAESAAAAKPPAPPKSAEASWTGPEELDAAAVRGLSQRLQSAPLPWVLDWTALQRIADDAVPELLELFGSWAARDIEMRWIGGEILLSQIAAATPVAMPEVDQRWWALRLLVLRMINRPEKFDEAAIDFCITYEISPPSWENTSCRVRISGPIGARTQIAQTTILGPASTTFVESELVDQPGPVQMVQLELSGQMVGDVGASLEKLDQQVGSSKLIELSCLKLLRVDFMASGELLNWVLAQDRSGRAVRFTDTNRLVARFFGAVGIDAHAAVQVRAV
ncbi:hypothetical protein [Piscinibacter sakaiensis]|uniref:hypothetical protein n=1 Tax=Piscinibacter sakaiensis TaxID=1547922 RepID=UPI003AAC9E6A